MPANLLAEVKRTGSDCPALPEEGTEPQRRLTAVDAPRGRLGQPVDVRLDIALNARYLVPRLPTRQD
jgi:hypothetical protein